VQPLGQVASLVFPRQSLGVPMHDRVVDQEHPGVAWQVELAVSPPQLVGVPAQEGGAPGNQVQPLLGRQVVDEAKAVHGVGLPVHTAESDHEHPGMERHTER
jgi:hypothetical protein